MSIKLSIMMTSMLGVLALTGCQTPLKSTALNQSLEKPPITLVPDIPDSDGDGVLDDIDECPATPWKVIIDEAGCPFSGIGVGLKMEYRAFFDKDSSELLPKYQAELDKVGMKLQEYKTAIIWIEGHNSKTEIDNDSIDKANALAEDRANKIKNYLISKYSIASERITTTEYGATRPIATSDSEEGNMLNRRVYAIAFEPEE